MSIDASRQLVACSFTASAATQIADAAQGLALWDTALNRAAVAAAGQMIGLAQRMVDMSVAYTSERKQFGKALASFQAVKHHMAEIIVKIEFAKPVIYRAAYALAHGEKTRRCWLRTPNWRRAKPLGWLHAKAYKCMAAWAIHGKSICKCL